MHAECNSIWPAKRLSRLLPLLLLVLACTSGAEWPLTLVVHGPEEFVAAVALEDGAIVKAECGPSGKVSEGLLCEEGRLRVSKPAKAATVKAPGFVTAHLDILGQSGDVEVTLVPLPLPKVTDTWRDGFSQSGGLDEFLALAYRPKGQQQKDDLGPNDAVKFLIQGLDGEPTVYFADTTRYPMHCDFAREVLKLPFSSCDAYAMATYRGKDRKQMAGTIYYRPDVRLTLDGTEVTGVFTVEFFPYDDLTPAMAALAMEKLQERMPFAPPLGNKDRLVYVPAGSMQEAEARGAKETLELLAVPWVPKSNLYAHVKVQYLNPGLSFGTLRVMAPEDLGNASYMDIVILTRLPNDLPLLGGTITEELQTPLAHVNVAARARGTPNLALIGASKDPLVAPLIGKVVRFEVTTDSFSLTEATPEEVQAFWDKRLDRPPLVPKADIERGGFPTFDELYHADAISVGVKAANVAELHHILGPLAPDGFAVPFQHYHNFVTTAKVTQGACETSFGHCRDRGVAKGVCDKVLSLCVGPSGKAGEALEQLIERVIEDEDFATNTELRIAMLGAIRDLFCLLPPAFAKDLDQAVADRFGTTTVRLRSSSNAEDLPDFTGAGLYTSVSAQAGSDRPPSARICKVWGSVWNFQAFEERAFWRVDHKAVKMGVAVHQAYPDEACNGVIITNNILDPGIPGMYVNVQLGEVSVTNPTNGVTPEEFTIIPAPDGTVQANRTRFSSLSPDKPILSDAEILALYQAAQKVHEHFAALYGKSPAAFAADIEFKFHGPERALILKQARPYKF